MDADDLPHQERLTDEELTKYKQGISEMWRVDDVAIRMGRLTLTLEPWPTPTPGDTPPGG